MVLWNNSPNKEGEGQRIWGETTDFKYFEEWYYEIALQIRKERVKEFEAKRLISNILRSATKEIHIKNNLRTGEYGFLTPSTHLDPFVMLSSMSLPILLTERKIKRGSLIAKLLDPAYQEDERKWKGYEIPFSNLLMKEPWDSPAPLKASLALCLSSAAFLASPYRPVGMDWLTKSLKVWNPC